MVEKLFPPSVEYSHWNVTVDASEAVPATVNVALVAAPASTDALDGCCVIVT